MAFRLAPNYDIYELLTLLAAQVGKLQNEKVELVSRNGNLQSQVLELHSRNSNLNKHIELMTEKVAMLESTIVQLNMMLRAVTEAEEKT
jgi:predicted nuclease with TOPRIM domain